MERVSRILVVEDSKTQAFKLGLLLEEQGWQVSIVGAAEAALAALGEPLPDLILLDYNLPGMRGDEFCRRIRMNLNTRGIPILMMTASAPETAEIGSLESGADDYASKLDGPDILLLRVRALLRKGSAQAPVLNPRDSAFRSARILTVDGHSSYFSLLSEDLRSQGYQVEGATGGPDGINRLTAERFDCALLDLEMPGMNGIEVCRRITAMGSSGKNAPAVIILTDKDNKGDMYSALEAGADDFVSKSSDLALLRARIQALMRRRFVQEESGRMVEELRVRELEMLSARAGREIAEARAAMAEQLIQANHDLQEVNRKLKETQSQLIQNEKMASLGQLVAGIAHEINNPLAFVVNNLFIVETGLDGLQPEMETCLLAPALAKLRKARVRLGEMKEGLDRVKELVLDLRTFSRLDEGELKIADIVETIDSVLLLFKHRMNGRILVESRYVPKRMLYCCAGRLRQVLTNLISNAADSIADKGSIFITTGETTQDFLISIRDTGTGIPEAIRTKIFDPFFTTKPVGQGTGLGLAISYGIIQDHCGSIEVQSKEGVGTEFLVKIPLDLEARKSKDKCSTNC